MFDHLQALVQIRKPDGKFVGNGFLHADGHVITCAHVVASCFPGCTDADPTAPPGQVRVVFYRHASRLETLASVVDGGWFPETDAIDGLSDVAILHPLEVPEGLEGLTLSRLPRDGDEYPCFVSAYIENVREDPVITGKAGLTPTGRGKRTMNAVEDFVRFIVPGCSGAAVFHRQGDNVEGIVEIRDTSVKEARFTPASALRNALGRMKATHDRTTLRTAVSRVSPEIMESGDDRFLVVHEYNLLETNLVGRDRELHDLSGWAAAARPILIVEAFGGYGKSALTWHWWTEQKSTRAWDGGFWFSFYSPSATQREFFVSLHAHLSGASVEQSRSFATEELAKKTLSLCRAKKHLIVLDGFERILRTHDRVDANVEDSAQAPQETDDVRPVRSALPTSSTAQAANQPPDPRAIVARELAVFLTAVADDSKSRVVITTRYMPSNLETRGGAPRRGVQHWTLRGLDLAGARGFWHEQGLDANDTGLERLRDGVDGHPLSLAIMAGSLNASGLVSLVEFFEQNRGFPILGHISEKGREDVFREALSTLSSNAWHLITILAIFTVPVPIKALHDLLCEPEYVTFAGIGREGSDQKLFSNFDDFANALLELRERNFVNGPIAAAVDLHPLIRSVVLARASKEDASWADGEIVKAASRLPTLWRPKSVEELATAIQLVVSAARTGNWRIAMETWAFRLQEHLERLHQKRLSVRLMSLFFKKSAGDAIEWQQRIPYFNTKGTDPDEIDQMLTLRGLSEDEILSFGARQDFSMRLASTLCDLGEYDRALPLYHIHNLTCPEPFCRTMQIDSIQEAGRFGDAARVLGECLADLEIKAINPKEKVRLANRLFYDCIDRDQLADARLALARWIAVLRKWQWEAFGNNQDEAEVLDSLNCAIATLARRESAFEAAVAIAAEVVEHAEREDHVHDTMSSLRVLAECLRAAGRRSDAADIYDRLFMLDPDGSTHGGAALDNARRARNRVELGDVDGGRLELQQALAATETMLSTHATILIFFAEMEESQGDRKAQARTLRKALDIYSLYPGAPIDSWGVRTTLGKLRAMGEIDEAEVAARQFAPPHTWRRWVLAGADEARVRKQRDDFPLTAIWSLDEGRTSARVRRLLDRRTN